MSYYKNQYTPTQGIFYYLNSASNDKYTELLSDFTPSTVDLYMYYMYGEKSLSSVALSNSGDNLGLILWVKYYNKWQKLKSIYDSAIDTNKSETYTYKETYDSTIDNTGSNTNSIYGFDSDTPKNDSANNSNDNRKENYTKTIERDTNDNKLIIDNKLNYVKFLNENGYLNTVIKDILKTISLSIYEIED